MTIKVTLLDYGLGNLLSVQRMLECCGGQVNVARRPEDIFTAERLVLPGVGAFSSGMQALAQQELVDPLQTFIRTGRHLLGICLGMHLIMSFGEENGVHRGLDLIQGKVKKIPAANVSGKAVKIPHIGWNCLNPVKNNAAWENGILKSVKPCDYVYFLHSFYVIPEKTDHCIAETFYEGIPIIAAIQCENVHGCQFHPEKSGVVGQRIINNFLSLK
jgi:glutamine amidotransferase